MKASTLAEWLLKTPDEIIYVREATDEGALRPVGSLFYADSWENKWGDRIDGHPGDARKRKSYKRVIIIEAAE